MLSYYREELYKKGVVEIRSDECSDSQLLEIAKNFGVVVPGARGELLQLLSAREKGNGPKGSFSHTVGYGAFPWHTDTAYWDVPTRYLLLYSVEKSSCATIYQDFFVLRQVIPDFDYLMKRAVYLLDIPGRKKYLSPFFDFRGKQGFRLDYHIYRPINNEAVTLNELVAKELKNNYHRQVWTGKNIVVIDNWRMIHAREDANEDRNRLLKRIYINELV